MADITLPGLLLLVYANPKVGKTSLFLRAFPNAICIGVRSAIDLVALNTCGVKPAWVQENVTDLTKLVEFLQYLRANPAHVAPYGSIYVDDFSHLCNISMLRWDAEAPVSVKRGRDAFYKYGQLDRHLDTVANLLRELGIPAGLSAHETKPDGEKQRRGAPEVPSANQVQAVPGWADLVARMGSDKSLLDPFWKGSLFVDPTDTNWITGDRFNVCSAATPANLREILRASQGRFVLPRYPGLEWQEQWATHTADMVRGGKTPLAAATEVFEHFRKNGYADVDSPGERHVLWAVQDGIARENLRLQRSGGFLGRAMQAAANNAPASAPPPPPGDATS
jgi:hypothetical protein